jgi:hypothetical protein
MNDKIQLAIIVAMSFALGWMLSPKQAAAYGTGLTESAYRMANTLDRIEQHLARCPR